MRYKQRNAVRVTITIYLLSVSCLLKISHRASLFTLVYPFVFPSCPHVIATPIRPCYGFQPYTYSEIESSSQKLSCVIRRRDGMCNCTVCVFLYYQTRLTTISHLLHCYSWYSSMLHYSTGTIVQYRHYRTVQAVSYSIVHEFGRHESTRPDGPVMFLSPSFVPLLNVI